MHSMRGGSRLQLLEGLIRVVAALHLLIAAAVSVGGESTESESFYGFLRAVDPPNVLKIDWNGLLPHPCSHMFKGTVKCNVQAGAVTEIRLERLSLSGRIDGESLCNLQKLQVLSLATNFVHGSIPDSISNCAALTYLNLRSNLLSGRVPFALSKMKNLRSLDISNNYFSGVSPYFRKDVENLYAHASEASIPQPAVSITNHPVDQRDEPWYRSWTQILPLVIGISFCILFTYFVGKKSAKLTREREILKALQASPPRTPPVMFTEEVKLEERCSELVFFVEEHERFKLEDLLEATADLRSQTITSSLYKVILKNSVIYAVKRFKNLQVSFEEFGRTMRQIGNLKHPNILPLVGFNSTNEEKLLIYKYQSNGSLLNLMENYIEGKKDFPWRLRLSIASGIAKGLDYMYQRSHYQETIPHGNLKLSNILLDENEDPLISEYGLSKFIDLKRNYLFPSNGYMAPEKTQCEQGDVFSFGIILLELLTGKTVEKSGTDLPKWVRAMVREEWTGEVFDKEVSKSGKQYAFPLLNVALKCVSHSPDNRPTIAEVLERISVVVNANEDRHEHEHEHELSNSSYSSLDSTHQDLLHTVIPETDTPGSNY
ncbi:probable leucine-rich repeat receptor-like protein kinase At5g05160 [Pistacia vera]|uniref:probable leucine-rich repeat receptor-like protein kinase At5g05160 n=1 Tax=Pistacia vera TaxID=55513 RepID=UPI001263D835|nr:probable leucine-rich repeat receptor-like protein kinase At5g05160 [Pistacia vera]